MLRRRLYDLSAADSLVDIYAMPQNGCHQLKGKRAKQLAVDLDQQFRLIFDVADDPVPRLPDGGLDRKSVRSIRILEVEDYHGKRNT